MKRQRGTYSELRERLRTEDAADIAKLTPEQRLKLALELSEFCLKLTAELRGDSAHQHTAENRRNPRQT
jgi:hypothetical protein